MQDVLCKEFADAFGVTNVHGARTLCKAHETALKVLLSSNRLMIV